MKETTKKLYDQLLLNENEIIINKNQVLNLSKKWLTLLVAFMCGIFSFVFITQTTFSFRFLSIPVFTAFLVYYAFGYAKIGIKEDVLIFKINEDELEYRGFGVRIIKTKSIVSVEDKSYFSDEDYGGRRRGWHHAIVITYINADNSQKTMRIDYCMTHQNHELFLKHMENFLSEACSRYI